MARLSALRRHALLVFLAMGLLLALAVAARALADGLPGSSTQAQSHAVLRWSNEGVSDLYSLDPPLAGDFNSRQAVQLIFGGLVRFGPGFRLLPDAAQSWDISKDGRTYTFHLRPNVRFGDGTWLTAQDVAYSLNRTLSPTFARNNGGYFLGDIEGAAQVVAGHAPAASGIRVLNRRTLRIVLHDPTGSFLAKLANPAGYIVPPQRTRADPKHWDRHAFGTGPFMVSRWIPGSALLLVPNPYYYGGKIHLAGIDMSFVPERLAAYKRYQSGGLDLMGTVHFPTDVLFDTQGRPDFHDSTRLETVFLTLNERRPPFNDARVRLAFAHALDKTAIAHEAFDNFAHPTDGMMPPGLPGYNPALHGAGYDPALARRLLARAGFPGGQGFPTMTVPVDQEAQTVVLGNTLARQWRRVLGVRVRLAQYTHNTYIDLLSRLNYQLAVIDWTQDFPDPQNFLSQQLRTGLPNNNGGWSDRKFDRLVDKADSMPGYSATRLALYRRAEEIAMAQAATIPLVNPKAGILLRRSISGIQIDGGYVLVRDWTKVTMVPGGEQS